MSTNQTARLERDMTPVEIADATENDDVDWGWVDCGPRANLRTLWRRLSLCLRIIGRINQAEYRTGPMLAWTIAAGIWPWGERVKAWGIVDDRR